MYFGRYVWETRSRVAETVSVVAPVVHWGLQHSFFHPCVVFLESIVDDGAVGIDNSPIIVINAFLLNTRVGNQLVSPMDYAEAEGLAQGSTDASLIHVPMSRILRLVGQVTNAFQLFPRTIPFPLSLSHATPSKQERTAAKHNGTKEYS